MPNANHIYKAGLTNRDSEDLSCYMTSRNVRYHMYCSSNRCGEPNKRKGTLVMSSDVSIAAKECPKCQSHNFLYYDTITFRA